MTRPCFLVIDKEFAGSISTRKLVIETAKFNVITAYSGGEAIATLTRFPAVSGVVVDAGLGDMPATELCKRLKTLQAGVPIIVVGRPGQPHSPDADHYIDSFDPGKILELLRGLEPGPTAAIQQQNAILDAQALDHSQERS